MGRSEISGVSGKEPQKGKIYRLKNAVSAEEIHALTPQFTNIVAAAKNVPKKQQ